MGKLHKKEHFIRTCINFSGWAFAKAAMAVVKKMPEEWLAPIGTALGKTFYYVVGKYRRIGMKNLRFAFGEEKSDIEMRNILKSCLEDIGINFMEVMHVFGLSPEQIKNLIEVTGKHYLDEALAQQKGIIALSAHLGNFILIGPRLIAEGYSYSVIARDPKNQRIARLFREMREQLGIGSIPDKPKKDCITKALKCLRGNGILFMQIDQSAGQDDPLVDFFGWRVPTFKGPVIFSLRTGAPVIPMFMVRKPDNRLMLVIEQQVSLLSADDKEEEITANVALLTKITENHIRRYPEQWWWLHRRWKKAKKSERQRFSEASVPSLTSAVH